MYSFITHVAALCLFFFAAFANAADIRIKMLNKSESGGLFVFEPAYIKANVNDTLIFIPTDIGHNTFSLLVTSGAQSWRSPYDKEFRVTLDKEGVYLYACDAHKKMGMVGIVLVGKASNMNDAKMKVAEESASMLMNKDRFTKLLDKVQ